MALTASTGVGPWQSNPGFKKHQKFLIIFYPARRPAGVNLDKMQKFYIDFRCLKIQNRVT
jgi:hypothetical protein